MRMDHKYIGKIFMNDGTTVPKEEWIVFRAKDKFVPEMLDHYIELCEKGGAGQFHVEGMKEIKERVLKYQEDNPNLCKVPDTYVGDMKL